MIYPQSTLKQSKAVRLDFKSGCTAFCWYDAPGGAAYTILAALGAIRLRIRLCELFDPFIASKSYKCGQALENLVGLDA